MINLSIFLVLYLIYVVIFLIFSFFNVYHMLRFGFVSFWAYFIALGYIIATIAALLVSYYFIMQIDWMEPLKIYAPFGE